MTQEIFTLITEEKNINDLALEFHESRIYNQRLATKVKTCV